MYSRPACLVYTRCRLAAFTTAQMNPLTQIQTKQTLCGSKLRIKKNPPHEYGSDAQRWHMCTEVCSWKKAMVARGILICVSQTDLALHSLLPLIRQQLHIFLFVPRCLWLRPSLYTSLSFLHSPPPFVLSISEGFNSGGQGGCNLKPPSIN